MRLHYTAPVRLAVMLTVTTPLLTTYGWAQSAGYTFKKISSLATPCTPAPGGGFFQFDFEPWGMNNRGDLAFAADFTMRGDLPCAPGKASEGEGAFLWRQGRLSQITRTGLPAPGGGTFTFGVFGFTSITDDGDVAFTFG